MGHDAVMKHVENGVTIEYRAMTKKMGKKSDYSMPDYEYKTEVFEDPHEGMKRFMELSGKKYEKKMEME